jgi:hypothetical protein
MTHRIRNLSLGAVGLAVVTAILFSLSVYAETQFRVAWESSETGYDHGPWMDVRSAFAWGERQAQETPDKRFWLEKQRKVLFIIPLAPDHVALPVRNTAGMRIGDIVRYHLPIWPQNKSKTGTLKRVYGNSFVVVDDMLMDVACVIEVSPSQRDT